MVPALVILALWIAVLGPGVVRWLRQHRPTTSIASFHRQLALLEVSGPKLVTPANRLGGERVPNEVEERRRQRERPQLVLLRTGANDKEHTMRYDRRDEDHRAGTARHARQRTVRPPRQVVEDPMEEWDDEPAEEVRREPITRLHRTLRAPVHEEFDRREDRGVPTRARHAAPAPAPKDRGRSRRVRIVASLAGTIAATFVLGLVSGLTILWAVTVVSLLALAGYLALMYYASSAGLYGAPEGSRPIARAVLPPYDSRDDFAQGEDDYYDDEDEDWGEPRVAAAR
jgi:hypothetical protein